MWPYPDDQAATDDALRLSRAMSHKNAMAGIDARRRQDGDHRRSRTAKTPAMFQALGRAVESLGGRYWAAEDVGISPADLAYARTQTRYVAGLEGHPAASGDPSPVTAEGVKRGIELCVRRALGRPLAEVTVAIQGVGHVGAILADKLAAAGAKLVICDVDADAAAAVAARTGAEVVTPEAIFDAEADVFAPCALGGAISAQTLPRLKARIVAGGANNQLADAAAGQALFDARPDLRAGLRHQRRRHHQRRRRDPRAGARRGLRSGLGRGEGGRDDRHARRSARPSARRA